MAQASDSFRLHSRYNPQKEATRYIDAQTFSCEPLFIVVTEPGESFLAKELRIRFPAATLLSIRYDKSLFSDSDNLWDGVWRPGTGFEISTWLFNLIPDEFLPLTVFIPWKPSDSVWPAISNYAWSSIASVIRLQSSVMYTRSMFGKRWLGNCIRNILLANTSVGGERTQKPVLLAASGPSLERIFPFEASAFYVCAVSSALTCLASHRVLPDICIATDGGYWALNHFRGISETVKVAFPLEAAVPSAVLERNPVQFLDYGSVLERDLFAIAGVVPEKAVRNGTVSGTAALYMLEHTDNSVYAAGLDLEPSRAFGHARPNAGSSAQDAANDRMHTLALSLHESNRETSSLEMYASWFASRNEAFKQRFFRLGSSGRHITGIQSVSLNDIVSGFSGEYPSRPDASMCKAESRARSRGERKELMLSWLRNIRSGLYSGGRDCFDDALYIEIFQMVSYTGYIRFLKKKHEHAANNDTGEPAEELYGETARFIDKAENAIIRMKAT